MTRDPVPLDASILVAALRDPASVAGLTPVQWTSLLAMARAEAVAGTLAYRVQGQPMPDAVSASLADHRASAEQGQRTALWEAEMCRRALAPLGIPTVLLKGTAYAAAGLRAAEGRQIGDLDILVPRDRLADAEKALLSAGWEWVKEDAYDDAYYRQWMHELPPMIHSSRDRMIDVHHTVLPLTAKITPDANAMLASAIPLPPAGGARGGPVDVSRNTNPPSRLQEGQGVGPSAGDLPEITHPSAIPLAGEQETHTAALLHILSPEDRIGHAAAHLFADGDLQGGLRNLWDIHCLINELPLEADAFSKLETRAALHGLAPTVRRAARLSAHLYGTQIPSDWQRLTSFDRAIIRRLLARNGWGQETRKFLRLAFYVRSHWLRMPPLMLARHLWTKWRKG